MGIQITRRTLLAMQAVDVIAQADGPLSMVDLSEVMGIGAAYVNQAVYPLVKAGILASAKGPGGGYSLGMPVEEIDGAMIAAAIPRGICPNDRADKGAVKELRASARDLVTGALQKIRFTRKGWKVK